jgi:hypothetical protein
MNRSPPFSTRLLGTCVDVYISLRLELLAFLVCS